MNGFLKSSIVFILVIHPIIPGSANFIEKVHENLTFRWCDGHPSAVLYTRGRYFNCTKRNGLNSFRSLAKETLEDFTLRVGIFEGLEEETDGREMEKNKNVDWFDETAYNYYVLRLLQKVLHFKINYVSTVSMNSSNGEILDLLDLMRNDKIDMSLGHWTVSDIVVQLADHVTPTLKTTEAFLFVPENIPLTQDVFFGIFSDELWMIFLLTVILLVICFKFSSSVHSRVCPEHEPWSWNEIILWAVAIISQQSFSRHPRESSCKTVFFMGYAISYLMYTGFAAGITSLLAINSNQSWLTFSEISSKKVTILFYREEYYYKYYFKFSGKNMAPLFDNTEMNHKFEDLSEIFDQIAEKNSVGYGTTASFINYLRKLEPSHRAMYRMVPLPLFQRQKSLLVRKSFPHKELFNYWLMKFDELGLLNLIKYRRLRTTKMDSAEQKTTWLSADLKNVFSAFVFLFLGWIFAVFVLFIEIVWWKRIWSNSRGERS